MSYTKTTWVTGDTITAAKLNNAEGGIEGAQWKSETTTPLFSESVTTAENHGMCIGALAYNTPITADTLIVTFNGTEYVCNKNELGESIVYGDIGELGPDFSAVPFALMCSGEGNIIFTETAGTYTVAALGSQTAYINGFDTAVQSFVPQNIQDGAGQASIKEGMETTAGGKASHAEGSATTAGGDYSHAEGSATTAGGDYSHAEGRNTIASGRASHAEGSETTTSAFASHAEGESTTASGYASHAQNWGTIAQGKSQTAIGKYNVAQGIVHSTETTDYAFIIGNGTENSRSNALAVRWDGAIVLADGTVLTVAQLAKVANLT